MRSSWNKGIFLAILLVLVVGLFCLSLFVGKYPLTLSGVLSGNTMQLKVFYELRLSRTLTALTGGFVLGVCGYIYQTVFRNPLASPDIIGVSSGACCGAAIGILFIQTALGITLAAFGGALLSVMAAILLSSMDRNGRRSTIVLAGIAIHALAQTVLMFLKMTADPEKELAAIEYWIMGSLSGITSEKIRLSLILCLICLVFLFLLERQILLLSAEEGEARMLGVSVTKVRMIVLILATLAVSSIVSLTGLISFVGLLAPHGVRLLTKTHRKDTFWLSGLLGSVLLLLADILSRSISQTELPVSIFTSLLGAPLLIGLIRRKEEV